MRSLAFSLAACLVGPGARADSPTPTLQTAIRAAVAARKVLDSDTKGSARAGEPFRGVATDGGVLVGLEVGLGRAGGLEHVRCVRPIYRAGDREWNGPPAGDFLAADVVRTVRTVAPRGYAVGGVLLGAGDRVEGLSPMFHRVRDGQLDPGDKHRGDWLGAGNAYRIELLDGDGRPVAGLFGRIEAGALRALGVTFADVPLAGGPNPRPAPPPVLAPRPKSILEMENEALRAARAAANAKSGGLGWVLGIGGLLLVAGVGFVGLWVWRRRRRGPRAEAAPALKPVLPLPSQWAPIRPGNVLLKGSPGADEPEADSSIKPPSIPAGLQPLLRPGGGGADVVWR